jgi:hypothetical protein
MRAFFWAAAALLIWALAAHVEQGPRPPSADAPAAEFSALRAKAALARLLGPQDPHPVGSPAQQAAQGRLVAELKALNVPATTIRRMSCFNEPGWITIHCATVTDILAEVLPGPGKAIMLMAHGDSVPAGPGAGDDGIGVGTLLETIRALKAAPPRAPRHPVIALFTDGEEFGLLGSAAFVRDAALKARAGLVINVEGRGDEGESLLFQTSPGDAALVDLYAASAPHRATSSLYREIYRVTPADTDMTPVMLAGLPGYNFASIGNVAAYHSPLDRIENLDPATLQSAGDNSLALVRALEQKDFADLKSGNAIYVDLLGQALPRLPVSWALPLSILAFVVLALASWRRRPFGWRGNLAGFLIPPLFLAGAAAFGWLTHAIAAGVSGAPDPGFAHPLFLRGALALAVWAVLLAVSRWASLWWCWLWVAALAVLSALFLPGASPYFLFPALLAMATLPFSGNRPWLAILPTLASLILWLQLTQGLEVLMGLTPVFYVVLAFAIGLIGVIGLLKPRSFKGAAACALLAVLAAVAAGLQPAHNPAHPVPDNLFYVESGGSSYFIDSMKAHLPPGTGASAAFAQAMKAAQRVATPLGPALSPPPAIRIARQGGDVSVAFEGEGDMISLSFPATVKLSAFTIGGQTFLAQPGQIGIICATRDCAHQPMVLHVASRAPFPVLLTARDRGLPEKALALAAQRPASARSLQVGDLTVRLGQAEVPGG